MLKLWGYSLFREVSHSTIWPESSENFFWKVITEYCYSRVPDEKPSKPLRSDVSSEKGNKKKEERERKERERLEKKKREDAEKQRKRDEEEKKRKDKEERKRIEKERKLFNVSILTYDLAPRAACSKQAVTQFFSVCFSSLFVLKIP